jgi:hypothetical protein
LSHGIALQILIISRPLIIAASEPAAFQIHRRERDRTLPRNFLVVSIE